MTRHRRMHYFDRAYTLDALGRVLAEDRGNWNGSSIGTVREDRDWTLGMTGNWATRVVDRDNDGTNEVDDLNVLTGVNAHFTNANEWTTRDTDGDGTDDLTLIYDANGNLTDDDKDYVYEYDAWNRLTAILVRNSSMMVTEYRYNGLGQRITESDGTDTEHLVYDDRWRLISRHDGASDYLEETLYHHAGLDGYGGASDVDSVLMRRTFLSTGTPQTEDQRWYVLQNWRQDVVAIINEAAVQRERVFYSPYGRVFGMVAGDTDFDGSYGTGDSTAISGWAANSHPYRAYADVDLDGTIDATDAGYSTNETMGWDVLSRDGSTVGYAGYVQDDYVPTVSHVRHRVYKSDLGRWVQRDPAGYVDGANLYEYVMSAPQVMRDAYGLSPFWSDPTKCAGPACRIPTIDKQIIRPGVPARPMRPLPFPLIVPRSPSPSPAPADPGGGGGSGGGGGGIIDIIGELGGAVGGKCCFHIYAGVQLCVTISVHLSMNTCTCLGLRGQCTVSSFTKQSCLKVSLRLGVGVQCYPNNPKATGKLVAHTTGSCSGESGCSGKACFSVFGFGGSCSVCVLDSGNLEYGCEWGLGRPWRPGASAGGCYTCTSIDKSGQCPCLATN
ncbi:MAG: RHS repeat-associated core domain-containing protein [Phycisphaerales bacterium JB060]